MALQGSIRELFGGAIVCGVPSRLDDVSPFRQIPDNQEVFSDPATDQSVIVELLQMVEEHPNIVDAAKYHFEELANVNQSSNFTMTECVAIDAGELPILRDPLASGAMCRGYQKVSKYKEAAENTVQIYLCLLRLPTYTTDMLITLNDPVEIADESGSKEYIEEQALKNKEKSLEMFKKIVRSVEIKDPGLFQ
tara:strand:- start:163 stop:741 length:579 start_codon:yes stop_codon:yes gene_type:complete